MQTIGIGMLGAGFIGQMHSLTFGGVHRAKHEPQLRARLIMLAEANQALAQEIQERYDWEGLSQDWRTAVEHPDVEIFVNAGPNDAHAEPNLAATAHGKHVFSEKPLARTADEAFSIWQAAEVAKVKHMCAFIHRFIRPCS